MWVCDKCHKIYPNELSSCPTCNCRAVRDFVDKKNKIKINKILNKNKGK